jgi:hypothetical protein
VNDLMLMRVFDSIQNLAEDVMEQRSILVQARQLAVEIGLSQGHCKPERIRI